MYVLCSRGHPPSPNPILEKKIRGKRTRLLRNAVQCKVSTICTWLYEQHEYVMQHMS